MVNRKKLFLIIQREFLVRLKSKIFIATTILAPIIMILILVLPVLIHTLSGDQKRQFPVYDETGIVGAGLVESDSLSYRLTDSGPVSLREQLQMGQITGYIIIPHEILDGMGNLSFYHDGSVGMTTTSRIRSNIREQVRNARLARLEVSEEIKSVLEDRVQVDSYTITETGDEAEDTGFSAIIGFIMGFIIYGAMLGYGTVILRSVMEEKTTRVVEVIASSVKPVELLMGKVIGIAMLGVTQFVIWAASGAVLLIVAGPIIAVLTGGDAGTADAAAAEAAAVTVPSIQPIVWVGFVLFFLLGFLIYSSLFAAVGSAIEHESDSQQLQMPIILLIIVPILFLMTVSDNPASRMSIILSMIPFFAPILMPVRMSVISVPMWQFGGTILLMVLTFIILMWLSARIYRTGILMYGKKASLREIWRWARQN